MDTFLSVQDFLQALADLLTRLEARGHQATAAQLREGLRRVDGQTDGWVLFLEAVETVQASGADLAEDDREVLERIRAAVRTVVYRR